MAAMGQQQPLSSLSLERLVSAKSSRSVASISTAEENADGISNNPREYRLQK